MTGLLAKYNLLLPHDSYLVGNNGGLIFNNDQQKVISENVFAIPTVQKIFALAKKLRCHLFARTSYDSLVTYLSGSRCSVFFWIYRWMRLQKHKIITYRSEINMEPITQFLCWGRKKNMHLFKKIMVNTQLSTFYSHHMWMHCYIDINPCGVNKKTALEKVAQKLRIQQSNIVYVGDGSNDLEAIKWAGIGVSVSNAHEDIKKHAQIITYDQKNAGFAHLISQLFVEFQI